MTADQAAQHFVLDRDDPDRHRDLAKHISGLWNGRTAVVRQCTSCGLGYSDPYVAGDAEFYRLAYTRTSYPIEKWEYDVALAKLADEQLHSALEIGAGFGYFLDKITGKNIPRSAITALDFSEEGVAVLKSKGYAARPIDMLELAGETFDAVFIFQVLEHLDRLHERFEKLSALLNRGAKLFVSTPNPKTVTFWERYGCLQDMPPNHIARWTEDAMRHMAEQHGLELLTFEIEPFSSKTLFVDLASSIYLRRAQTKGTIAQWARVRRAGRFGKLRQAAAVLCYTPQAIIPWLKGMARADLGGTQIAIFRKPGVPHGATA